MTLSAAISPCPNDTFLFAAWAEGRAGRELPIDLHFADIQQLNEWALAGRYPICKVSFAILPRLLPTYQLLPVGAALGWRCGPLLVARSLFPLEALGTKRVALPGRDTTARLLLERFAPPPLESRFYPFHKTVEALDRGEVDCAILIHEQRFTYQGQGLSLICDLGTLWHDRTGLPLPLGGLVAHRSLPDEVRRRFIAAARESLTVGWSDPKANERYVLERAQEMAPVVVQAHIETYVTAESHTLSEEGLRAIDQLLSPEFGRKVY